MIKVRMNSFTMNWSQQPVMALGSYESVEPVFSDLPTQTVIELVSSDDPTEMFGSKPQEQKYVMMTEQEYNELLVNKVMMTE